MWLPGSEPQSDPAHGTTRREFVKTAAAAGGAMSLGAFLAAALSDGERTKETVAGIAAILFGFDGGGV